MIVLVIFIFIFVFITLCLIGATVFSIAEEMYLHVFKKPFYIHFYPRIKSLSANQESILRNEFLYYRQLTPQHQRYFKHRVAHFLDVHQFIAKDGFVLTDMSKVLIAATAVQLSFGMRKYIFEVVDKIIIYPSIYRSVITGEMHKGEFNPRVRAVVFSWEDFLKGHESGSDNLNLGLHEFSHVVHYHGNKNEDISAILFLRMYKQITAEVLHEPNKQRLVNSNYFRIYAYTNQFEFLAVLIEHYFETPRQFKQEFPELYRNVGLMLNHRHAV